MLQFHACPATSISILIPGVAVGEGAYALAHVLQDKSNLVDLRLNYNYIGDEGTYRGLWSRRWAAVAFTGRFATKYSRSDASPCGCLVLSDITNWLLLLSRPGARAISDALKDKSKLTWLNLSANEFTVEGRSGG